MVRFMQRHGLDVTWHVNDGGGDAYGMMGGGGSGGGLRGGNSLGDFVHSEGQSVNFSLFFFSFLIVVLSLFISLVRH